MDLKKAFEPKIFLDSRVPPDATFEDSQAVVVPFGYEGTVTYGHGTAKGAEALIEASYQVEAFDDELLDDIQNQIKFWTIQQPDIPNDPEKACLVLKDIIKEIIDFKKFPVVIGGEHMISYGFTQGLNERYKNISVLSFDAHMDLGDRFSARDFSHASWLKHSLNLANIKTATLVGIRNFNKIEWEFYQNNKEKVKVFFAKEKGNWSIKEIVDSLGNNVYLTFDIDVFDSSAMPSTGTPEPGGLFWDEVLPIIHEVAKKKNLIGMDLVELAPIEKFHAPDFLAAKLLMKMILYKFRANDLKT